MEGGLVVLRTIGLCLWALAALGADRDVLATEFEKAAFAALPVEQLYDFRGIMERELYRLRRDLAAKPRADELAISETGWTLAIPAATRPALRSAAEDFTIYLKKSTRATVPLRTYSQRKITGG
jgi:hypothetical protein